MVIEKLTVGKLLKAMENMPHDALVMLRDPKLYTDFHIVSARPTAYEADGVEALILIADHPMIDEASTVE